MEVETELNEEPRLPVKTALGKEYESYADCFPSETLSKVQSAVVDTVLHSKRNVALCAPTASGKTLVYFMAILQVFRRVPAKAIYFAPTKLLAKQLIDELSRIFKGTGHYCYLVTGETKQADITAHMNAKVIVATPEKWLSLMEREDSTMSDWLKSFSLAIIDEGHLLGTSRGMILEALVWRMFRLRAFNPMRIIIGSATLPNVEDLGRWLSYNADVALYNFNDEWREIAIQHVVQGYAYVNPKDDDGNEIKLKGAQRELYTDGVMQGHALKQIFQGPRKEDSVLVFVNKRKQTLSFMKKCVAYYAQKTAGSSGERPWTWNIDDATLDEHAFEDESIRDDIKACGFAPLHAGTHASDRNQVIKMFEDGLLKGLVCTSFAAAGINSPAIAVYILNPHRYSSQGAETMSNIEIRQMQGRAGRPGWSPAGSAIPMSMILTTEDNVESLSKLELQPIESGVKGRLLQYVLREIASGSVKTLDHLLQLIKSSYYVTRASKNPAYYPLSEEVEVAEVRVCVLNDTASIMSENSQDPAPIRTLPAEPAGTVNAVGADAQPGNNSEDLIEERKRALSAKLFDAVLEVLLQKRWIVVTQLNQATMEVKTTDSGKILANLCKHDQFDFHWLASFDISLQDGEEWSLHSVFFKVARCIAFDQILDEQDFIASEDFIKLLNTVEFMKGGPFDEPAEETPVDKATRLLCVATFFILNRNNAPADVQKAISELMEKTWKPQFWLWRFYNIFQYVHAIAIDRNDARLAKFSLIGYGWFICLGRSFIDVSCNRHLSTHAGQWIDFETVPMFGALASLGVSMDTISKIVNHPQMVTHTTEVSMVKAALNQAWLVSNRVTTASGASAIVKKLNSIPIFEVDWSWPHSENAPQGEGTLNILIRICNWNNMNTHQGSPGTFKRFGMFVCADYEHQLICSADIPLFKFRPAQDEAAEDDENQPKRAEVALSFNVPIPLEVDVASGKDRLHAYVYCPVAFGCEIRVDMKFSEDGSTTSLAYREQATAARTHVQALINNRVARNRGPNHRHRGAAEDQDIGEGAIEDPPEGEEDDYVDNLLSVLVQPADRSEEGTRALARQAPTVRNAEGLLYTSRRDTIAAGASEPE